ncbi:MAG: hypothetical protein L0G27_08360, partial [Paracoccus sp. (in: a-proteobacteria)]|nr:hypothetical protein [Paracoccus sp. (in: a-proteobacteria)]
IPAPPTFPPSVKRCLGKATNRRKQKNDENHDFPYLWSKSQQNTPFQVQIKSSPSALPKRKKESPKG